MQQPPSPRILLAEEQAASRDLVVLVLGKLGYRIETVTTSREVLDRLGTSKISLVLLSTTFEDRVGTELLHQIRAGPRGSDTRRSDRRPDRGTLERSLAGRRRGRLSRSPDRRRAPAAGRRTCDPRPAANAATEQDSEPVIDLDHLSGFTDGDRQLEGELLMLFLSSADVYLARMSEALRTGQSWTAVAHALKGASANLGARRVMEFALAAERSPPTATQLEALRVALEEVRDFERTRQ